MEPVSEIKKIAFLGDYLPRKCGIATFTSDVLSSVAIEFPKSQCFAVPVNDIKGGYEYPREVRFEIEEQDLPSYLRTADFLNISNADVLCVQHEFGIYGGPSGSHLLALLRELRMPIVTTLHTILREPNPEQRRVMQELIARSTRLVVMAERGKQMLLDIYQAPPAKIDLIPHGIPDMSFVDPNFYKDQFGVEGRVVLLTFGLLSPNKGIEHVLNALPAIVAEFPNIVYIVLGATHPNLVREHGETYRLSLERLAKKNKVEKHVIFYNRFVELEELKEFIGAADIYITPYLNEAQITSGTLAYTFGAGKAVVSTPYWHAQELLAGERGVLVPFRDSDAIAEGVNHFLSNPTLMTAMRKRAWKAGREMIWPVVARRYMESFERARASLSVPSVETVAVRKIENANYPMPPLKLDHLLKMSDHTGIFQHAIYNVPNYHEGYCTDDNARAFILTVLLQEVTGPQPEVERIASSYLAFLWYAFDANTCRFRNFMNHHRQWIERAGSEDSHARALWAVGTALGRARDHGHRNLCALLFQRGLPPVARFSSPRAWAFALLAIHEYLRTFSGDRVVSQMRDVLAGQLVGLFRANSAPSWQWFERIATYDNAKLSHALILSGHWTSQGDMLDIGLSSLRWLLDAQTAEGGHFAPIGCHGFWRKGGRPARFDQQPLEAHATISACLEAFSVTRDDYWKDAAQRCFEWFLGRNDLGQSLYDPTTGGCRDALLQDHLNQNQGAESSLAFYLSSAELTRAVSAQIETIQTCAA